jgi:PAS domain S-box-containing protein
MAELSINALSSFNQFAERVKVGFLVVSDEAEKRVLFASRLEAITGFKDRELIGSLFNSLLPESIRERHDQLMETLKTTQDASISRSMAQSRTVSLIGKNGKPTEIVVNISYHPDEIHGKNGFYLALIQHPDKIEVEGQQLESLQGLFTDLLPPKERLAKKTKAAIAGKVATKGGIFATIAWLLTEVTPLGSAFKAAVEAFSWEVKSPEVTSVGVYQIIDDETRKEKIVLMRNALRRISLDVYAVAYFKLVDFEFSSSADISEKQLKFVASSGTIDEEEIWFFDRTNDEILFTRQEMESLLRQDCIFKRDAGYFPKSTGKNKFSAIYCPTFRIEPDVTNPGLKRVVSVNVAAIAVSDRVTNKEPWATILWRYIPNLESTF